MAEDFRQKTQRLAREYRDYWAEHPNMAMAIGFTPVAGQIMGLLDTAAAYNDERASNLERGLATAGILPVGKLGSFIKGALGKQSGPAVMSIVGPTVIKRAEEAGLEDKLLRRHYDPDFKTEVAELRDYGNPNQGLIDVTNKTTQTRTVPMSVASKNEPLSEILPEEIGKMPVSFLSVRNQRGKMTPLDAGGGAYTWGSVDKSAGGKMELHTGSGIRPLSDYDYNMIARTQAHEVNHAAAGLEVDAGVWGKEAAGSSVERDGFLGYFNNLGELDSYTRELRMQWPDDVREEMLPWQTRRALQKRMEENLSKGRQPNYMLSELANPKVARQYMELAEKEPVNPKLLESIANKRPNWNTRPKKRADGSWIAAMPFDELVKLDPKLGQKMKDISGDGSWSARYKGDKPNYAKQMATGETIEPIRVKVRLGSEAGRPVLETAEMDGLRRALAARNMFGYNSNNRIPVIFEPVDAKTAKIAANDKIKSTLRPATDLMLEDDRLAPRAWELADKMDF